MEQVLNQVSRAITSDLNDAHSQHRLTGGIMYSLAKLEIPLPCLSEIAYEWCTVVWRNRQNCTGWRGFLVGCFEAGFRHVPAWDSSASANLIHTEDHHELISAVFESNYDEAIADVLRALTLRGRQPPSALLDTCAGYIVDLPNRVRVPFTLRLHRIVMRSIELIGFKRFEEVGAERFGELLNHLLIRCENVGYTSGWVSMVVESFESPGVVRRLAIGSWEALVELVIRYSWMLGRGIAYNPHVTAYILEAKEWDKLECWMGIVWATWPPETDDTAEDLRRVMELLFRQRFGAVLQLTQWMENRNKVDYKFKGVLETFRRICDQAQEAVQPDAT